MTSIRDAFNKTPKGQALVCMADRYAFQVKKIEKEKRVKARQAILHSIAKKMFIRIGHDYTSYNNAKESIDTICHDANYKTFQKAKVAMDMMYTTPVSNKEARINAVKTLKNYALSA